MIKNTLKQAVILAAGRGSRLGNLTANQPKCLLTLGEKCILEHQLSKLEQLGISQVELITGFGHKTLQNKIQEFSGNVHIRCHYNPDWETSNNIVSLACAFPVLQKSFLLLESDVMVFCPLPSLLTETDGMVLGNWKQGMQGTRAVMNQQGLVTALNTQRLPDSNEAALFYKTVNLYAFHNNTFQNHIQDQIWDLIKQGKTNLFYETAIANSISKGLWHAQGIVLQDRDWCEIDTPQEYELAQKNHQFNRHK